MSVNVKVTGGLIHKCEAVLRTPFLGNEMLS